MINVHFVLSVTNINIHMLVDDNIMNVTSDHQVHKVWGPIIWPMGQPWRADRQVTMTLHMCGPRWVQSTELELIRPVAADPDSKVHGANMGPTRVLSAPDRPYEPCYLGSYSICKLRKRRIKSRKNSIVPVIASEMQGKKQAQVWFISFSTLLSLMLHVSVNWVIDVLQMGLFLELTHPPGQNGHHFADNIFKCIFLEDNVLILIKISLKFIPTGPITYIPALVQIMGWRRPGDKPLSEPMLTQFTDAYMRH